MATSLGRFLRKLRIDHDEILINMADKLGVSASFLSAVENGKKRMPAEWNIKICELYTLNMQQQEEFTKAIAETEKKMEIDLADANFKERELAISFARKFSDINDSQIDEIRKILYGG
ncbi:MAG: helix-turn-helix transcriptional regulator [Erysipelotrichaceae bacterium]|nr:helix-turn-helix transcriptional regulator [Erysipelotrichaceae bacterium]